jgi:hypothetical protein
VNRTRVAVLGIALAVGLAAAPSLGQAAPVVFFNSPGDDGAASGGIPFALVPGSNELNLFADPTRAGGGGVFGVSGVLLETFGDVTIASFNCTARDCLVGMPVAPTRQILFTAGDEIDGERAVFRIGDVRLDVMGSGGFRLVSGGTLTVDLSDFSIDGPQLIAVTASVPEPAGLGLFAVFLGGALLARGRRLRV